VKAGVLFAGMFKRRLKYLARYQFDSIAGLMSLFIVFVLIFYGARALIGSDGPAPLATADAENTLAAIVVIYMVWMLGIFSYGEATTIAYEEATAGTLEQLAMSPFGLRAVLVAEYVGGLVAQLVQMFLLAFLMMAVSGQWLHVDMVSILPLVLLTMFGVYGLGLMLAGLAVVFKRIQQFLQVVQFLMIVLVAVPTDQVPAFKYLPLAFGRNLIQRVMVDEQSIFSIPLGDTLFLLVHAVAWLALGLYVFGRFEHVARERALLGHY
jgi:ABC-2 type transport system permease protein